jgi:quinol monooxygenase YgiN
MIVIEGTFRIDDPERARPHMNAVIAASRAETGCIDYAYAYDVLDPTLVRVHERWQDRESLAAHAASAHVRAWRATWAEFGGRERSLRMYEASPEAI